MRFDYNANKDTMVIWSDYGSGATWEKFLFGDVYAFCTVCTNFTYQGIKINNFSKQELSSLILKLPPEFGLALAEHMKLMRDNANKMGSYFIPDDVVDVVNPSTHTLNRGVVVGLDDMKRSVRMCKDDKLVTVSFAMLRPVNHHLKKGDYVHVFMGKGWYDKMNHGIIECVDNAAQEYIIETLDGRMSCRKRKELTRRIIANDNGQ